MPDNDPRTQADEFADLARERACDQAEAAFDERPRTLATAPKAAPKADEAD